MMIQRALKWAPNTTTIVANSHSRGPSRLPPNRQQAEEAALEGEREHALRGEQAAEHVAHEPGVVGPVHAELELLDDARGDAHREDQAVDLDPEERQLAPLRVLGPRIGDADDDQHQPEAHRERRVQEVEARRQGELDPRQELRIRGAPPSPPGLVTARRAILAPAESTGKPNLGPGRASQTQAARPSRPDLGATRRARTLGGTSGANPSSQARSPTWTTSRRPAARSRPTSRRRSATGTARTLADKVGNAGDEIRKDLGNAGDDLGNAVDKAADKVKQPDPARR